MNKRVLWTTCIALVVLLTGCSAVPLPMQIDLKARLGSDTSGVVEEEIGSGTVDAWSIRHPRDDGECVDFDDVDVPVTVQRARLIYNVSANYSGPALAGVVDAQLYASRKKADLFSPQNKIGPKVEVDLGQPDTRLSGAVVLTRDQVRAINDRRLCWGAVVSGDGIQALEDGQAEIEYEIDKLMLDIRFSVF